MCVWNTNNVKSDGEIATKLGTWTKFDFVKNMGCFVSSVVSGIWEGKATKIFHGNVYRVEPPSGGSWTTRIIDVMLENLMCCREILCCWNERIQENLIQLSCQTITLWFPRQEARWQCSHQIEFVMTETNQHQNVPDMGTLETSVVPELDQLMIEQQMATRGDGGTEGCRDWWGSWTTHQNSTGGHGRETSIQRYHQINIQGKTRRRHRCYLLLKADHTKRRECQGKTKILSDCNYLIKSESNWDLMQEGEMLNVVNLFWEIWKVE